MSQKTTSNLSQMLREGIRFDAIISSPIGPLGIQIMEGKLANILFLQNDQKPIISSNAPQVKQVVQDLNQYFESPKQFSLPLQLHGTPFQRKVWQALTKIPIGRTMTYQDMAIKLNVSAQAIGGACKRNPCPIVVPCHRIIAKKGLGGYSGHTEGPKLQIKTWLLTHESAL